MNRRAATMRIENKVLPEVSKHHKINDLNKFI